MRSFHTLLPQIPAIPAGILRDAGCNQHADQSGNPRVYTRSDGTAAASFEITATNLQILSSRSESDGGGYNGGSAGTGFSGGEMGNGGNYDLDPDGEDIPF